jgi:hypothetical protein
VSKGVFQQTAKTNLMLGAKEGQLFLSLTLGHGINRQIIDVITIYGSLTPLSVVRMEQTARKK